MSKEPEASVPYRPMPWGYILVWVALSGALGAYHTIHSYGWPPGNYGEFVSSVVIEGLVGGYLWGWVFWKFVGLYKRFPPRAP